MLVAVLLQNRDVCSILAGNASQVNATVLLRSTHTHTKTGLLG